MIQTILLFALGFLSATFLALLAAPVLWRRAVSLTTRRVEASTPLSRSEFQADKDRLRADFAMSARRLEMSVKALKEKLAGRQVEIGRQNETLKELSAARDELHRQVAELRTEAQKRQAVIEEREQELAAVAARLAEAESQAREKAQALEEMSGMYEEASYASSSRQIELVGREAEIDRLTNELRTARSQRKDAEQRAREAVAQKKAADTALRAETKRAQELDRKLERLMAALSDSEEKLERREAEAGRLRQEARQNSVQADELAARLNAVQIEKTRLQEALDRASASSVPVPVPAPAPAAGNGGVMPVSGLDRQTLESRIAALARENRRLRVALDDAQAGPDDAPARQNTLLREQINDLAAEVVQLTAMIEGPDSPLRQAFANGTQTPAANGVPHLSIADRVRALRKVATPG